MFPRADGLQPIDYRDNYFGFCLGKNTAAFRLDWEHEVPVRIRLLENISLEAEAEYTISGAKSPLNPWTDYDDWRQHGTDWPIGSTRWLRDERLEHGVRFAE